MDETVSTATAPSPAVEWEPTRLPPTAITAKKSRNSVLEPCLTETCFPNYHVCAPFSVATRLVFDYGLIILAIVLCEDFWHPVLYLVAVMIIGARQAGIGSVALHDGVHRMLSRNRRLNDLLGRSMCATVCTSILMGFDPYRESHFAHHRVANTERDPDVWIVDKFYSMPRWKAVLAFVLPLTGVLFVLAVGRYITKNWRQHPLGAGIVLTVTAALLVGWYAGFYPAVLAVMYWFVPLATWGIFINQLRALAEHYPENEFQRGADFPRVFRTRDVINSWFDATFHCHEGRQLPPHPPSMPSSTVLQFAAAAA